MRIFRIVREGCELVTLAISAFGATVSCARPPLDVEPPVTAIAGRVEDEATGQGLAMVSVSTVPATTTVVTTADGTFRLEPNRPGSYRVVAQRQGFEESTVTVDLREGTTVTAVVRMKPLSAELVVSPAQLDLGATIDRATVSIQNRAGVGVIRWSARTDQPWISLSVTSGSISTFPMELIVDVNRAGLPWGVSTGSVNIQSDAGDRVLTVRVERVDPSAPRLQVSTTTLTFGDTGRVLPLDITDGGAGTLSWRVSSSAAWLTLSPSEGSGTRRLQVAVDRTGLAEGQHSTTLAIVSNGGSARVNASVTVAGPGPTAGRWGVVTTFAGMRATSLSVAGGDVWVGGEADRDAGAALKRWNGREWSDEAQALGANANELRGINDLEFAPDGSGIMVGTNVDSRAVIVRRVDGRYSRSVIAVPGAGTYAVRPLLAATTADLSQAWIAAYAGWVHHTNGVRVPLGSGEVGGIRARGANQVWAATASRLYMTDGASWVEVAGPAESGNSGVEIATDGTVFRTGANGIGRRTASGGWVELRTASGARLDVRGARMMDGATGWAFTGTAMYRVAGGVLTQTPLPTSVALEAVRLGPEGDVWAVGNTGDRANGHVAIVLRYR